MFSGIQKNIKRLTLATFSFIGTVALLASVSSPVRADGPNPKVKMTVETGSSKGKKTAVIEIELFAKDAPKTVDHILALVKDKFYDGILFHRYAAGFVVQAGDPKTKKVDMKTAKIETTQLGVMISGMGEGGSGTTVPLEAKAKHDRGTLGLARSQAEDSGDSQFFFNLKPNNFLDSGYCSFGKVTKGLAVMDSLRTGDKIKSIRLEEPTKTKPTKKAKMGSK